MTSTNVGAGHTTAHEPPILGPHKSRSRSSTAKLMAALSKTLMPRNPSRSKVSADDRASPLTPSSALRNLGQGRRAASRIPPLSARIARGHRLLQGDLVQCGWIGSRGRIGGSGVSINVSATQRRVLLQFGADGEKCPSLLQFPCFLGRQCRLQLKALSEAVALVPAAAMLAGATLTAALV